MNFILDLVLQSVSNVLLALLHNWPYLLASVFIAVLLKRYLDAAKVSAFLMRYRGAGVAAATTAAVATPLCSCGTTAVVLGMMASMMPWAPIVAFMVASPLTSPEGLIYNAGLFGWPFSIAFFLASILLGLTAGWITTLLENRGWLANQNRYAAPQAATVPASCACAPLPERDPLPLPVLSLAGAGAGCACDTPEPQAARRIADNPRVVELASLAKEMLASGRQLLVMFLGFAFIGYFLNGLIPAGWVSALFGGGNAYSVPLAATLGLPLYINSEASMPLIRSLLDNGMSQGAALAFMIAGAGTSIGAIAGALTIARWRVVALVVGILWVGAIASGYAYNLFLLLNWA